MTSSTTLHLSLPATSANLGPGFDAVGLALSLRLEIEACTSDAFALSAQGCDAEQISKLDRNLILETYTSILQARGRAAVPIRLRLRNDIPLGMGCGSSAAALCAGVYLADHFGGLGWSTEQIVNEAARREGHPDNVAACVHGGLTVSRMDATGHTVAAMFGADLPWRLLLALPQTSLATHEARALLPETYGRADVVNNIQGTALLVSAFALNRPELLRVATEDRVHQPYRRGVCPLFAALEGLRDDPQVYSVTLSGAGPSCLLIVADDFPTERVQDWGGPHLRDVVSLRIAPGAARQARSGVW